MRAKLADRDDYVDFVEKLYFGALQRGDSDAVLHHFAPGALLTGYAGDAPARVMARIPGQGQSSLDAFMQAAGAFDLSYLDFVHFVDTQALRVASYFTLIMQPKAEGAQPHMPIRRMRNCSFFQFGEHGLESVVAYFSNPADAA